MRGASRRSRPAGRDGDTVWWLADVTDRQFAEDELAAERARTTFLAEASNVLLASLNTDRCMRVTAQLAAQYLAEAARRHRARRAAGSCPWRTRSRAGRRRAAR